MRQFSIILCMSFLIFSSCSEQQQNVNPKNTQNQTSSQNSNPQFEINQGAKYMWVYDMEDCVAVDANCFETITITGDPYDFQGLDGKTSEKVAEYFNSDVWKDEVPVIEREPQVLEDLKAGNCIVDQYESTNNYMVRDVNNPDTFRAVVRFQEN